MIKAILILLLFQLYDSQAAFDIMIEDVISPFYDEEYITEPDVYMNEDYEPVVNFSIIKQFPSDTQVHFELLGASMGEYVIQTGIDMQMELCEVLNEPILMGPILKMFGFSPSECPPPVGIYGSQGVKLPMENFPDDFPPNKYLSTMDILYEKNKKLLQVYIYINIQ